MPRTLLLCTVLLAACDPLFGAPTDRTPCASSAACPAGQFCAPGDPRVCWDDPAPPAVTGVTVRCATTPCLRDATLTVEASASDDQELGAVTVSLDLDGGARQVPMARVAGALHRATLDLSEWPLAGVEAAVVATVRAVDGARQATAVGAPANQRPRVTRLRPAVELGAVPTAPALLPDGTVVVGGADGRLRFLAPGASAATSSAAAFGPAVVQPPTVGQGALWVVSGNNRLYAASLDGGAILNGTGYDTGGAVAGPAAVTAAAPTEAAPEVAFVGSAGGRMAAVKADAVANGFVARTTLMDAITSGPVLFNDASAYLVTGSVGPVEVMLRKFSFDGAFGEGSKRAVGSVLSAPVALTPDASAWTASSDVTLATLQQTNPDGSAGASIPLGASPGGGAVVLSDGDVAICVGSELRRFTAAGVLAWAGPAALSGAGLTPIALAAPGAPDVLLVPTRAGTVDAVRASDGALLWSASLTVNVELREGTVRAAPAARTSTAWFTSADGLLHGLVVDGALDPAAPWPKAWHDPRNTGNLASSP